MTKMTPALLILMSSLGGTVGCLIPEDAQPRPSACLFTLNGESFGTGSAYSSETGEEEAIDFDQIRVVCNYKSTYDSNVDDGGAPEPFHITPACESMLEQAIRWDTSTFVGALGQQALHNGIRGIHAMFFQPVVFSDDAKILKHGDDEFDFAPLNSTHFAGYPNSGERTLSAAYYNEQIVRDFCNHVEIIGFEDSDEAAAKIVNGEMTLLSVIPEVEQDESGKHLLGRIIYHESMHFAGGHTTCTDDIADSLAGVAGACDEEYDMTYHVDSGWLSAAAIGGLVYRIYDQPMLSRESMAILLESSCQTFTRQLNPQRTLFAGAVDCLVEATQVLDEYLHDAPEGWPGVPGGLPCDRGDTNVGGSIGCGGGGGGDTTGGADTTGDADTTGRADTTGNADTTGVVDDSSGG